MNKDYIKDIPNWEKNYLNDMKGNLSKQEIELLEGRDIQSHEGCTVECIAIGRRNALSNP